MLKSGKLVVKIHSNLPKYDTCVKTKRCFIIELILDKNLSEFFQTPLELVRK
jgi:hypothetical protein